MTRDPCAASFQDRGQLFTEQRLMQTQTFSEMGFREDPPLKPNSKLLFYTIAQLTLKLNKSERKHFYDGVTNAGAVL